MSTAAELWVRGVGAGAVAAALDVGLIVAVEPHASRWVLLEAGLFWTAAGLVVVAADFGLGWLAHGLVTTVLLAAPWIVAESFAVGHPAHFVPLVVQSLVFGTMFARVRRPLVPASGRAP
ncbi:MAG: hypothetical protein U0235_03335 [Polyangiaceae bacterium]